MTRILWACWDGGGNLPPTLGIVHELERRGHEVALHGRDDMVPRARAAGLTAYPFAAARADQGTFSFHPLASVFGYCCSPAVGEELVELAAATSPDLVVIDAMFGTALDVADRLDAPTVVMLHTFLYRGIDAWRANLAMQSQTREKAGFAPLASLDVLWGQRDRVHVNTLAAFDGEPTVGWGNVVHGAPVLASETRAVPSEHPWEDDGLPLVLLSFSTVPEQRSAESLQRALDALGTLPVRVVATTGGIVDPEELAAPANAHVVAFADHDALIRRASLVVGHGGHGTTMRALRAGVPIVGMPAKGTDQATTLQLLDTWHAGIALPGDADVESLRSAVVEVLGDPSYRETAQRLSRDFDTPDGAVRAADSVEAVLGRQVEAAS